MNEIFIHNINNQVGADDVLFHLGDWCFSRDKRETIKTAESLRKQIRCKEVVVIIGNHDPRYQNGLPKTDFADLFEGCFVQLKISAPGFQIPSPKGPREREITLSHYSMKVWDKSHHGCWHLYGHSHASLPDDPGSLSFDVGVDAVAVRASGYSWQQLVEMNFPDNLLLPENYRPISLVEVADIMSKKNFKPIDHHGI